MLWNRNLRTPVAGKAQIRKKAIATSIKSILEDLEGRRMLTIASFIGTSSYTQNFDSLPATATAAALNTPTDLGTSSANLNGWFFNKTGGNTAAMTYVVNSGTGTGTTGAVYNYGVTGGAGDRALGSLQSGTQIPAIGAVIANDSGSTVTDVVITFEGEQWRRGATGSAVDRLDFSYQTGTGTSIASGTFTPFTSLNFSSLQTGTVAALDGNASGNHATVSATLSGLTWAAGENLIIKWDDFNVTSSDDGLAIDSFVLALPGGTAPAAPTAQTAVQNPGNPSSSVDLTWLDNSSNEDGFYIERALDSGFTTGLTTVTTTGSGATTYTDTGLASGTTYYYRVRATNTNGNSVFSNFSAVTTAAGAPSTPTGLATSNPTTTSVDVSWSDLSNEDNYVLEYTVVSNGTVWNTNHPTNTTIVTLPANTVTTTVSGLEPGIKYYFRLKATNTGGSSAYTSIVNGSTTNATLTTIGFNGSGAYSQNFNNLNQTHIDNVGTPAGGSGSGLFTAGVLGEHDLVSANFYSDKNAILNGWSMAVNPSPVNQTGGSVAASTDPNIRFGASDGTLNSGGVYSYGSTSTSDRALGMLVSGSNKTRVGATFINTSAGTINNLSLAYVAETWRGTTNASEKALFEYKIVLSTDPAPKINDATGWTAVDSFSVTKDTDANTNVAYDGNNATYRSNKSLDLTALGWNVGDTLIMRWTDVDDSGSDAGIAIDDFSMQITPANAGTFNVAAGSVRVNEGGTATITVNRTGGSSGPADVLYSLTDITATTGLDYTAPSGTLSFADGELSKDITISISTDSLDEIVQTFNVVLGSVTNTTAPGGAIGANTTTTVKIVDTNGFAVTTGTPFTQDWSTTNSLITAADQWDNILDITGYENNTALINGTASITADATNPGGISTGGAFEFESLGVVGLQGTGTASVPQLIIDLDTTGLTAGKIEFDAKDIDGSADDNVQVINVSYRVGNSGGFTTIGTIADATTGPSLATLVTHFMADLPAGALGQSLVQIQITNADVGGVDEFVGIDNINISAGAVLPPWLNPTSSATWDDANNILTVTGNAEIIADPLASSDTPTIIGSSAVAQLLINPTTDDLIHIDQLNFTGGAKASVFSRPISPRDAILLALNGINLGTVGSPTGKLDLGNNNLAVNYGANPSVYSAINSYVLSGLTLLGGADGNADQIGDAGIGSTDVDLQSIAGTVLGVVDDGDPNIGGGITSLSGQNIPAPATSVIIKFTWFGDATLDGVVDGSDYALTDTGFTSGGSLTGWVFGDMNFDGVVTGEDYALVDTGFIAQNAVL